MKLYKTYRFKAEDPNPGKVALLRNLAAGPWRKGLNFCLEQAKRHKPHGKRGAWDLHPFVYRTLRSFGLPAQLAEDCRDKAYETYSSHMALKRTGGVWRRFPHFDRLPAIRFNIPRSCRPFRRGNQYWVELATPRRRVRLRLVGKPNALRKVFESRPEFVEIVFREHEIYVHFVLRVHAARPDPGKCLTFIGVDQNAAAGHLLVAVARNCADKVLGTFWVPIGYFLRKLEGFHQTRRALQKAGGSRKLKRLRRKETDFTRTFMYTVTKRLVEWASQFPAPFIAPEDLTGIRTRTGKCIPKSLRRKIHSWSYGSGRDMLVHKGLLEGMFCKALRGAFSSRYCSRCGSRKTRRSGALFACRSCGYGLNVHLNGARSMSWRAFRYTREAAGRADSVRDPLGVKGWGRTGSRSETATSQSGPYAGDDERAHAHVLKCPSGMHSRVSCKPPALAVG